MSKRKTRNQQHSHGVGTTVTANAPGTTLSRRAWVGIAVGGAATVLIGGRWWRTARPGATGAGELPITVYASPSCGCCHNWVAHLEDNQFHVTVENLDDVTPMKTKFGVPDALWSCHTAMVSGYVVEGHVPADLIQRILRERPAIAGLAAPGMPNGSPGMEGSGQDRYEIIAFTRAGETSVYAVRG